MRVFVERVGGVQRFDACSRRLRAVIAIALTAGRLWRQNLAAIACLRVMRGVRTY